MHTSVSPSCASGCLLRFLVSADLVFPQSPSAQSSQHLSECSPLMYLLYPARHHAPVPHFSFKDQFSCLENWLAIYISKHFANAKLLSNCPNQSFRTRIFLGTKTARNLICAAYLGCYMTLVQTASDRSYGRPPASPVAKAPKDPDSGVYSSYMQFLIIKNFWLR